jgi:hypothetical protein
LIVILTVTTEYAYSTLAVGFVLSFVTAAVLMALVDPAVTEYRDRVRGRTLRLPQVNVGGGVEPSQPAAIPLLNRAIQAPGSRVRAWRFA